MRKKIRYSLIFVVEGMAYWMLMHTEVAIPCLFKSSIHVPCPGCGMTRAFREIFRFHFDNAFHYNILALPIFAILLLVNVYLIIDIFHNRNYTKSFLTRLFSHPVILFSCLFLSEVINLYRGI